MVSTGFEGVISSGDGSKDSKGIAVSSGTRGSFNESNNGARELDAEGIDEPEEDADADGVIDTEDEGVIEVDAVGEAERDAEADGVVEDVADGVADSDIEVDGVVDVVADGVDVAVAVGVETAAHTAEATR